jgi:2-polyprenyl-3-methyl-5-hydroxy-6-metoxy-1,4-benzoquinol methylase
LSLALAFLGTGRPLDYGARLARLRWRRAAEARTEAQWDPDRPAADALGGEEAWLVVVDPAPLPAFAGPPGAVPGRVLVPTPAAPPPALAVHTLRELEEASLVAEGAGAAQACALLFRQKDFPPGDGSETIELYIGRLLAETGAHVSNPGFRVLRLAEASERERPELTRRLPEGPLRILDVGCGAGGTIAAAVPRHPGWRVMGIEEDSRLAALARACCGRVVEGDLRDVLAELGRTGERFDAVVFADVLEHLEDPVSALAAGRAVADAGARLLVSVPNVGHLSIVRDLVAGRFDPIPAGLTDARHLRWFTRAFLAETIEEAGWRLVSIESERGAPPPDPSGFLARTAAWPGRDDESLATYQWIALGAA